MPYESTLSLRKFFEDHGPAPWPCHFCGEDVTPHDGHAIHHLDGDHSNDVTENRVMSHDECHKNYHSYKVQEMCKKGLHIMAGHNLVINTRGRSCRACAYDRRKRHMDGKQIARA